MLPTFVIGLREGLEAALIVGIIAAFLRKQGRRDLVRWVFVGVGVAILLCAGAGAALELLSKDLPQRQQEGLETVIGALAVGMVTYMVIWMKRHSRDLKGQLEGLAAGAIGGASGGARAMVLMAFLAVLREGLETVVFLIAAFNVSSGAGPAAGAVLGLALAVLLGYGIYRGGVRINLSKFFRATGLVLVLVAAGLVVNALRTAHEANWLTIGQGPTIDLTWLVHPGSVQASLLTGMLGLQSRPVVIEVVGWLVYLVPVGLYVAWPPGKGLARRTTSRVLLGTAVLLGIAAGVLAAFIPGRPASRPALATAGISARYTASSASDGVLTVRLPSAIAGGAGDTRAHDVRTDEHLSSVARGGLELQRYRASWTAPAPAGLPRSLTYAEVAAADGGRLPIGLKAVGSRVDVTYADRVTATVSVAPRTGRVVDLSWTERVTQTAVTPSGGRYVLSRPAATGSAAVPRPAARSALAAARHDVSSLDRRALLSGLAWSAGVIALVALLAGVALALPPRRARTAVPAEAHQDGTLVRG